MPKLPTWDDVKKLADELENKVKTASASARAKWDQQLRPKVTEIQQKIEQAGHRAGDAIQHQVSALSEALSRLHHEIAEDLKIGTKNPAPTAEKTNTTEPNRDEAKPGGTKNA